MTIGPVPADQGEVGLEFFDADGRSLSLFKPWPARDPILIDPQGQRLTVSRQISLHGLLGWRGVLPQKGAVELRMPRAAHPVAFADSGMLRLAAWRPLLAQVQALTGADGLVELGLVTDRHSPKLRVSRHDWQAGREGALVLLGDGPVELHASTVHAPVLKRQITASGAFDPTSWLGDVPHLWFVQGRSAQGVMRPFPWSSVPVPHSTRDQRINAYLGTMTRMMAEATHPGWADLIEVMEAARAGGDCGSLDQTQALGLLPEVAVALLFRADPGSLGALLELETEAPLWWPAVPVSAWAKGIGAGLAQMAASLKAAGFDEGTVRTLSANQVARTAGVLRALRPELSGHLGLGMLAHGLAPLAFGLDGQPQPLAAPRNPDRLKDAARQLAARGPNVPQGAATLRLGRLTPPSDMFEGLRPLLVAPLVVAEVALGLRPALTETETLDLLALRHVDPLWFDTALPLGLSLA